MPQNEMKELTKVYNCNKEDLLSNLYDDIRSNAWMEDELKIDALESPLMRLCAKYLYCEKRRGLALDGVANFHLRNGAVMWRLNWRGDCSARGLGNSCGIMVNYKYCLDDLEENSTLYQEKQEIRAGDSVIFLVKM